MAEQPAVCRLALLGCAPGGDACHCLHTLAQVVPLVPRDFVDKAKVFFPSSGR